MKDAYYFISDAHLGLDERDEERFKEQLIVKFLDEIETIRKESEKLRKQGVKIQVVDNIADKVDQMVLRKPILQAWRQQKHLIRAIGTVCFSHVG